MAINRSFLEELPIEIPDHEIAPNLDKQSLLYSMLTSQRMYHFFKQPLETIKLLDFVNCADYEHAQAMINISPALMFMPFTIKKIDGSYQTTTPLKLAYELLDTYMWKMFWEKIKTNPQWVALFLEQVHGQTEHVNLDPLFAEYKKYQDQYKLWLQDKITNSELATAWLNVGKKQREILPRHMLKEFCRPGHSWGPESLFDVTVDPIPTDNKIYNYLTSEMVTLFPFKPDCGLGNDFTLTRSADVTLPGGNQVRLWKSQWNTTEGVAGEHLATRDLATFRQLYDIRTEDCVKELLELEPKPCRISL
ncbi:MAG: hypothetical protein H0W64_09880 [Gammaproteobacteria bacterium]|nr:hypothetical protein [Gammaproteobacteria bacterium]